MNQPFVPAPSLRASGAVAGAAAGLLVAGCAVLPLAAAVVVFVLLGGVLAYGWPRLLNLPSPRGTCAVVAATTVALAGVMVGSASGERARWAGAVLCLGLIGSFLHQLLRQDGRPRLVSTLAGTALALGFLGAGSYLVAAQDSETARELLAAAGGAAVTSALVEGVTGATPRRFLSAATHVLCGACVGLVAVLLGAPVWAAVTTGGLCGLLAWSALRTTVTVATSAHIRAQLAAGAGAAMLGCFVPYALAHLA